MLDLKSIYYAVDFCKRDQAAFSDSFDDDKPSLEWKRGYYFGAIFKPKTLIELKQIPKFKYVAKHLIKATGNELSRFSVYHSSNAFLFYSGEFKALLFRGKVKISIAKR